LLGLNEGKELFFSFIIDAVCTCKSFLLFFVPSLLLCCKSEVIRIRAFLLCSDSLGRDVTRKGKFLFNPIHLFFSPPQILSLTNSKSQLEELHPVQFYDPTVRRQDPKLQLTQLHTLSPTNPHKTKQKMTALPQSLSVSGRRSSSSTRPGPSSHGRGGAGNISTSPSDLDPNTLETPTLKGEMYTTGRGGSGNMARNTDAEAARKAQDVVG
jgi:hypothetical protein